MEDEKNGTQEAQGERQEGGSQQQQTQETHGEVGIEASAYEAQIAERDGRIAELEAQVAEAAKNAETAEQLRGEIAALKEQGESDRIDFKLQLTGCRNVKAARAVLGDHDGDVDALKEAEPWMFAAHAASEATGKTGLPNAGAAADDGKQMKRWEKLAGLADDDE